jgi:hypothetical protein
MEEATVTIALKSAAPGATHIPDRQGLSGGRAVIRVRFGEFMDREYVEDCADVAVAKRSLAIAGTDERIPWDQLKEQLGL